MRKIFILLAFIFATLTFTSCEEFIIEHRSDFENSVLSLERSKLPFIVEKYKDEGIAVKSITIDTVVMSYETDGNIIPSWGYFKTTWEFPLSDFGEKYIFSDEYDNFYSTYKKEILVEIVDLKSENGHYQYKTRWPSDPLKTKNKSDNTQE